MLLRSGAGPDDRYVRALDAAGWSARCLPVLRFAFPRQEALRERGQHPDQYAGLIVTSPRAVRAIAQLDDEGWKTRWQQKPAYAVGPKTASALRALGLTPVGEETGSAASLAAVIAKKKKPYLFLCGNRRRDVLPDALRTAGTAFEELIVYETHLRSNIVLPRPQTGDWLVFFSPSGLEAVTQSAANEVAGYRLAAIGPTTADALRARGTTVEAVASSPSPEGLVHALRMAPATD